MAWYFEETNEKVLSSTFILGIAFSFICPLDALSSVTIGIDHMADDLNITKVQ